MRYAQKGNRQIDVNDDRAAADLLAAGYDIYVDGKLEKGSVAKSYSAAEVKKIREEYELKIAALEKKVPKKGKDERVPESQKSDAEE